MNNNNFLDESETLKIIFDGNPKEIVEIFMLSKIAGFQILRNINYKTVEMMQQFVDNLGLEQSEIPMYLKTTTPSLLDTATLKPNDNMEISFGCIEESPKKPYITVTNNQDENTFSTSTLTVNPLSINSSQLFYSNLNRALHPFDRVEIQNTEVVNGETVQESLKIFNVYNNGNIEEVQGEEAAPHNAENDDTAQ